MPTSSLDDLIGSRVAAAILHIDQATLNRWSAKGLVPVARNAPGISGAKLYSRTVIAELALTRIEATEQGDEVPA